MVRLLGKFVRCESPSHDKAAVDRFGRMVAAEWKRRGAKVRILRQRSAAIMCARKYGSGKGRASGTNYGARPSRHGVSAGHAREDAVPRGARPRVGARNIRHEGRACAGAFCGGRAARPWASRPRKRLVFFWNSDEEIGSATSRRAIEREARRSDAVLVLEPAFGPDGRLKTARKGVGTCRD